MEFKKSFPWDRFVLRWKSSPWLPLVPAAVAFVDKFILILPTDVVVAVSVLVDRTRWWQMALFSGLAGSLGNVGLFSLASWPPMVRAYEWMVAHLDPSQVESIQNLFQHYGPASLLIVAVSPLPMHIPIFLCAFAKANFALVALFATVGTVGRYFILAYGIRQGWAIFNVLRDRAKRSASIPPKN